MILSPLWLAVYVYLEYGINVFHSNDSGEQEPYVHQIYLLCIIPFVVGILFLCFATRTTEDTKLQSLVSVPVALYGFIVAATWIDAIADQLVSVLSFLGILCYIPADIMGLTVLAIGNSFGDFAANVSMARKGLVNMAITACFAGPVFSILIGVGLGFYVLGNALGKRELEVHLTLPLKTAIIFSMLNCVILLISGVILGRGRLGKMYGLAALILYATYTCISLAVH